MKRRIVTVVGARPQFVKAAAISRVIRQRDDVDERIVHTGQHYDQQMSAVFFAELGLPEPHHHLAAGSGHHGAQTAQILDRLEPVLMAERPDWVLLYGDTNSTLAGALAAAKLHLPIAHVEAGLRSFNRRMPEEINRVLTDHLSNRLFCPSQTAVDNLTREGITKGVELTGDVMFDVLQHSLERAQPPAALRDLAAGSYVVVTVHRAENTDDPARLAAIFAALRGIARNGLQVVVPLHPRTAKAIANERISLDGLLVLAPLSHSELVAVARDARAVLTDSGGLQKEAYWLGVPCITLRDETEWVETVANGWNVLVGSDEPRIRIAVECGRVPSDRPPLYGERPAADAIVESLCA